MSFLKEGDSINFQKASCTLDGCVKIYTSRVDSVATETGKLLSGLSTNSRNRENESGDAKDAEGGEEDEEADKRRKRKTQRSEATLVKDFAALQLKKLDTEFLIDPLFKKMSADFDEGGARGLLLNHLSIDRNLRVIFANSDNDGDSESINEEEVAESAFDIDLEALGAKYFPDMDELENLSVCPSGKNFDLTKDGDNEPQFPNLENLEDKVLDSNSPMSEMNIILGEGNFDDVDREQYESETGEGQDYMGGDQATAWNQNNHDFGDTMIDGQSASDPNEQGNHISLGQNIDHIFAYFDESLKKNWAGPEHWRIQRLKKDTNTPAPEPRKKKERETFRIDFSSDHTPDEEVLFATGGTSINLPKTQWRSKTRNLLPDDKHFSSKRFLTLFLKPKAIMHSNKAKHVPTGDSNNAPEDEQLWGEINAERNQESSKCIIGASNILAQIGDPQPNYDANFFDDAMDANGGPDDDVDASVVGMPIDGLSATGPTAEDDIGENLVSQIGRVRPEYVNYARTAKRVDVKLLKDNMWSKLDVQMQNCSIEEEAPGSKKFTEIIGDLEELYPAQQMNDISTSFCFICLLHLANEKGLKIEGNQSFTELKIAKDPDIQEVDTY